MKIDGHTIGSDGVYVIADISANHCHDFDMTKELILAAKNAGANAVKLQTFRPGNMAVNNGQKLKSGLWAGYTLYDLYEEIAMPWEWQPQLKYYADEIGITLFSTPFSVDAVDFLEDMDVACYKIASPEIHHLPLQERIIQTGKPVFYSTGCSEDYCDISQAARRFGKKNSCPLHCVSEYPAPPEEMALMTIPALSQSFGVHVGLSDHSKGIAIVMAAVAMGVQVIEKHIKIPRTKSADSEFSITPREFADMVHGIRQVEKARLGVKFKHHSNLARSIWVTKDIGLGEEFTKSNIAILRPSGGLHPRQYKTILGKMAKQDIKFGIALSADMI